MPCNQCGTDLPEHARFCLNCGAPVPAADTPAQPPQPPRELDFVQPALVGGMFLGLLSSLPLISAGNCLCCMWVLGGGGIAAYLLTKQRPDGLITYGDAAFGGVMSGLFGSVVATVVSIPTRLLMARFMVGQEEAMEEVFREFPVEGPMRDLIMRFASPEVSTTTVLFMFIYYLLLFSLFAMIGGILAVAIMKNQRGRRQPPSPIVG